MVGSPFRSWSAIQWRDIVAGAQTERRGGAGPAGACLAVRIPPAAVRYRRTCGTVGETVLPIICSSVPAVPPPRGAATATSGAGSRYLWPGLGLSSATDRRSLVRL